MNYTVRLLLLSNLIKGQQNVKKLKVQFNMSSVRFRAQNKLGLMNVKWHCSLNKQNIYIIICIDRLFLIYKKKSHKISAAAKISKLLLYEYSIIIPRF